MLEQVLACGEKSGKWPNFIARLFQRRKNTKPKAKTKCQSREGLSSYNNPSAMMSSSSSPSTTTTVIKSCLDILRRLDPAETEKVR